MVPSERLGAPVTVPSAKRQAQASWIAQSVAGGALPDGEWLVQTGASVAHEVLRRAGPGVGAVQTGPRTGQ